MIVTEFQFDPAIILVQPGEQVIITATNTGAIFHTFTFRIGDQETNLSLNPGETKST